MVSGLPCACFHFITESGEHRDAAAAYTTRCPAHEHGSLLFAQPVLLHSVNGQSCSESRRAENHRFAMGQSLRERHDPIGRDTRICAEPAEMPCAQLVAGHEHLIALAIAGI
ncbi:hypothetical protein D3C85_1437780 [compost metagenome]